MPDIIDEIIELLPPSTIRKILDLNSDYVNHGINVSNLLRDTQVIKKRQVENLNKRIFDLKTKTAENRNFIEKLKKEIENFKSLKKPEQNEAGIKTYATMIKELEAKIKQLTKDHGDVDLEQLYLNIENYQKEIEEYKKKIADIKSKIECYDGFPPNIEEGKEAITKVKERIKQNEAAVESFYKPH